MPNPSPRNQAPAHRRMHTIFRAFHTRIGCVLALLIAASPPVFAQPASAPPPADPGVVRLATTPVRVRTLGLTIYIPEGARSQTDVLGSETVTRIIPQDESGVIAIQGRTSNDPSLTPETVADGIIAQLRAAELIDRTTTLQVGSLPADRFYVRIPAVSERAKPTIHGYTVFVPSPGRVIILELLTSPDRFAQARAMYETTVATIAFADPGDLATRRHTAVQAGIRAIEQIGTDAMDELIAAANDRWERFYTPAITGADEDATEHGYRRVRAWKGKRGELDPDSKPARWSAADREEGYLVRIDARLIETDLLVDSQAVYFLSLDGSAEGWSIRLAVRRGANTSRLSETGFRTGDSMKVSIRQGQGSPRIIEPVIQGDGYLPALQNVLLGQILARVGVPADYAFYAFRSQEEAIKLRQDTLERIGGPDGPVKITSRLNEDAPPQIAYYSPEGSLIRIERPDGRIWAPTSLDQLIKLWRSKGLPLD